MARLTNYEGGTEVLAGFIPKNNGTFALMEAHDIVVDEDGTRLDEVIGGKQICITAKPQASGNSHKNKLWEQVTETKYKIKISSDEYDFERPYIDEVIVYGANGVGEKTVLDALELLNGDIILYSNLPIDCKIVLKGE